MRLRTSRGVFVSWAAVFCWAPLIYLGLAVTKPKVLRDPSALVVFAIVFGSVILMYLWLRAFTLEVNSEAVTYSTLFGGQSSIALAEIARVEWKLGYARSDSVMKPLFRLEVIPRPDAIARPMTINAKVFDRKALAQFAGILEQHIDGRQGG